MNNAMPNETTRHKMIEAAISEGDITVLLELAQGGPVRA